MPTHVPRDTDEASRPACLPPPFPIGPTSLYSLKGARSARAGRPWPPRPGTRPSAGPVRTASRPTHPARPRPNREAPRRIMAGGFVVCSVGHRGDEPRGAWLHAPQPQAPHCSGRSDGCSLASGTSVSVVRSSGASERHHAGNTGTAEPRPGMLPAHSHLCQRAHIFRRPAT